MIITCLSYTNKKDFTKVKYEFNLELFLWVICLFVWGFSSHSKIFHSFEDVTAWTVNLTLYTLYSWRMSSEGSLLCHIFCDRGQPFTMVISEDL